MNERHQHSEWMRQVALGDAQAFRALSDRFLAPMTRYAGRMLGNQQDAQDVAQDTMLRVWANAKRYVPTASVSTWMYRIAHNLCIDRMRKLKPTTERISQISADDSPNVLLDRKQLAARVDQALSELPGRQRAAIGLVHYEGLGQADAAKILGTSVPALESLLSRGRRRLRAKLEGVQLKDGES